MSDREAQNGFELLKLEYESCSNLIKQNIEIIQKTEVYAVGGCAAIFAFALGNGSTAFRLQMLYLCPLISVLGWLRFEGINNSIRTLSRYIENIENKYPILGYNKFRRAKNPKISIKWNRRILWLILFVVTLFFSIRLAK